MLEDSFFSKYFTQKSPKASGSHKKRPSMHNKHKKRSIATKQYFVVTLLASLKYHFSFKGNLIKGVTGGLSLLTSLGWSFPNI